MGPLAKVRWISIKNYKGIENVELELPGPRMKDDPDVMVIGSQNGLGKTSILECCSLLLSTLVTRPRQWEFRTTGPRPLPIHLPDLLVRAGADQLKLDGELWLVTEKEQKKLRVSSHLTRRGDVKIDVKINGERLRDARKEFDATGERESIGEELISVISGLSADPMVTDSFLLFHSYRKAQEGNPELGPNLG
ncbi:MAG: hypothetical protein TE42_02805 [Candidatus Synechococcus spongiarum SP3]|uniref:Rad50/SbcC-type AAA domain-containing protein n=1 Tax=Candidatus Synechococcus spongiarum SP3 TaxID=1604020 RepID=A0A0G2IWR8_9SYNE|nr:MAG: hypothetical protein TE42_02805 [Candidatus Synechococcus spongiarum SP3]